MKWSSEQSHLSLGCWWLAVGGKRWSEWECEGAQQSEFINQKKSRNLCNGVEFFIHHTTSTLFKKPTESLYIGSTAELWDVRMETKWKLAFLQRNRQQAFITSTWRDLNYSKLVYDSIHLCFIVCRLSPPPSPPPASLPPLYRVCYVMWRGVSQR